MYEFAQSKQAACESGRLWTTSSSVTDAPMMPPGGCLYQSQPVQLFTDCTMTSQQATMSQKTRRAVGEHFH
ncbi:hypothetical protein PR048_012937 [Dryococelus australis]|uniref:Uncharacterized protein n=1 Tax=Dryococelus australis TaxID=614101 RepID=A0ABQ9HQS2_9NEOP|nr:hypothetical protein PR048_012937 [Dryococelus australis]